MATLEQILPDLEAEDPQQPLTGEYVEIPDGALIEHLDQINDSIGNHTFLRRVADFVTRDGKMRASLGQVEVKPAEEAGWFNIDIKSHKKEAVLISGAALLLATAGVRFQRNRTQRKKMKRGR